jgi:hypothetical protein
MAPSRQAAFDAMGAYEMTLSAVSLRGRYRLVLLDELSDDYRRAPRGDELCAQNCFSSASPSVDL